MSTRTLIFSRKLYKTPHLGQFFPELALQLYSPRQKHSAQQVAGWGLRPTTRKARAYAAQHQLPYVALEDGFLRSVGLGVAGYPPFALVYDDIGIYYDTTCPSRLEQLILAPTLPDALLAQAQAALQLIRQKRLTKYNQAGDFLRKNAKNRPLVLVVDQTFGDMAIQYGQADHTTFSAMLSAAIAENPAAEIWVKTHPDVLSGKKKGYFQQLPEAPNLRFFTEDVNTISLLEQVDKVYCVTSQMGFEALLLDKPVVTFGVPWFAGWGLTDDRHPQSAHLAQQQRRSPRPLLHLFACAYLQYSRYINPYSGTRGTIFDVIDYLAQAKQLNQRLAGDLYCVGMSLWKRAVMKPFFNFPNCRLHFVSSIQKLSGKKWADSDRLLLWGAGKEAVLAFAAQHNIAVLRMEDGFIRSVGLGSNLVAPLSLVIDDLGIYFDARTPSRLEAILQHQQFSTEDLARAQRLQTLLIEQHIGKYNVGAGQLSLPDTLKRKILVPGQVEDDASIRFGSPQINKNLDLLKRVRELNPQAFIIYKPHPDVVSGNRQGQISEADSARYADLVLPETNILDCINQVDEVHTMTSLAGFEALLRGKIVHCYGMPFYAGWGLTRDLLPITRRTRQLRLEELICATLVYYPQYIDPRTRQMINAEQAIALLEQQRSRLTGSGLQRHWLAKQYGKLKQLYLSLK